jgi:hypothetical protein
VVDYLRERLGGTDLSQAYAAWQALQPMVDDDSRRVAEAAVRALTDGVPRVTPATLDLDPTGSGELRLEGTPIALTAVASSSVPWLKVEQDGATVRVRADGPGDEEASVVISGPTGEQTIPVHLTMPDTESEPPPPPPEPEPSPPPPPQPEPPHQEPLVQTQAEPPAAKPEPPAAKPAAWPVQPPAAKPVAAQMVTPTPVPATGAPASRPPWWLIAVLVVGSGLLIYLNWPGEAKSSNLWYDPDHTGWHVYRSWSDPVFLSSIAALVGSLVARWTGPVVLGVVAGAVASVLQDGLLILGAGIWENNTETPWSWIAVMLIGVAMAAVLLIVLRPERWRIRPVPVPGAILVGVGGILVLLSGLVNHPDGFAFVDVTLLAVLEPLVVVALAWLALAAVEPRAVTWLTATATTYAVISAIAAVPALTGGDAPIVFLVALLGNALIVVGVLSRVLRLQSHP